MRKKYKLWPKSAEIILKMDGKTLTDEELAQKIRQKTGFLCDSETVKKKRQSLKLKKEKGPRLWHEKNARRALDKTDEVCDNEGEGEISRGSAVLALPSISLDSP